MANDLNSVILVGRLTREADLKYSSTGTAMLRFSIAVNRNRRNQDGSWSEEPHFFDCLYAGRNAQSIAQFLDKGRQVAIQGELRQSRWTDQEGQARSRVEIFVTNLTLLQAARESGSSSYSNYDGAPQQSYNNRNNSYSPRSNSGYTQTQAKPPVDTYTDGPEDFQDDDIPF